MNPSSKTLFLDTATRHVYLSVVIDGVVADAVYQAGDNDHSVTILPLLEAMLKRLGIGLRDLDLIVVGVGPGSYTGVRIGVSIAKMIGYLNGTPVRSVSSLALLASGAPEGVVLPFVDARRGNAFMGLYRIGRNTMEELTPDVLENVEAFRTRIAQPHELRLEGTPDPLRILNSTLTKTVEDIHALIPNYLQVTEAERKKADA